MQDQKPKELRALSASLIKTWEQCSQLYYAKYVLRLPDSSNDGAKRGTICHKLFELLQHPRHFKHFNSITLADSILASAPVTALVEKYLKRDALDTDEHREMVYEMIVIGLKFDFFLEGNEKLEKPEFKFDITDPEQRFRVKGFIDQLAFFKDHAVIKDFKSSKKKFAKGELNPNLQNFIYTWAVWHLFKVLAKTRFLFLRFPKQPVQEPTNLTEADLQGIEEYFAYVSSQIQDFDEKKARKNLAANGGFATKWLCGKTEPGAWCCSFRKPFNYFALTDQNGVLKKTAMTSEELSPKDGDSIEERRYKGCPKFYGS